MSTRVSPLVSSIKPTTNLTLLRVARGTAGLSFLLVWLGVAVAGRRGDQGYAVASFLPLSL